MCAQRDARVGGYECLEGTPPRERASVQCEGKEGGGERLEGAPPPATGVYSCGNAADTPGGRLAVSAAECDCTPDDGTGVGAWDGLQAMGSQLQPQDEDECDAEVRAALSRVCMRVASASASARVTSAYACARDGDARVGAPLRETCVGRLLGGAGSACDSSTESSEQGSSTTSNSTSSGTDGDVWEGVQWAGSVARTAPSVCSRDANRRRRRRRGREESMAELRDRYMRYAFQIDRLIARQGKKWGRVEVVRARQRRCMISMLQCAPSSQTRALQRVRAYVDCAALREFESGEDSAQVYVHVHPDVRHSY